MDDEKKSAKNADEKDNKKNSKKKDDKKSKESNVNNVIELNPELDDHVFGEAVSSTCVFTWGRMNPPTVGHEKLVQKVLKVSRENNGSPRIYLTHSQDPKRNPLPYKTKIRLAQKAFGKSIVESKARTLLEIIKEIEGIGYKNIIMVVGQDRLKEFETILEKYNGRDYNFDTIRVISAGDRDPDAEDVTGMSASKMRALAAANDVESFRKGLPSRLQSHASSIVKEVRTNMNIKEDVDLSEAVRYEDRVKEAYENIEAQVKSGVVWNVDFKDAKSYFNSYLYELSRKIMKDYYLEHPKKDELRDQVVDAYYHSPAMHTAKTTTKLYKIFAEVIPESKQDINSFLETQKKYNELMTKAKPLVVKGRKPSGNPTGKVRSIDNTGTCGICGKNIKLSNGGLVNHGFTVRGRGRGGGWRSGACFGVNKEPIEVSKKAVDEYIKVLDTQVKATKKKLQNEDPGSNSTAAVKRDWKKKKAQMESEIRFLEKTIELYSGISKKWKKGVLPGEMGKVKALDEENVFEVLSIAQRRKRAQTFRRAKARIKRGREISQRRMASPDKLAVRARKKAIQLIRKKVAGKKGMDYANLSPGEKVSVDRLVAKRMSSVGKIAKRLMPKVKTAERERLKSFNQSKATSEELYKDVLNIITEAYLRGDLTMDEETKNPAHPNLDYKRFHQLLDKKNKPKHDQRFRFNKKVAEMSEEEFVEVLDTMFDDFDYFNDMEKIEKNLNEKAEKADMDVNELFELFLEEDDVKNGYQRVNSFIAEAREEKAVGRKAAGTYGRQKTPKEKRAASKAVRQDGKKKSWNEFRGGKKEWYPNERDAFERRVKEELELDEMNVGDTVVVLKGPHKGAKHEIINVNKDGSYNVKPVGMSPAKIKYRLGAVKAQAADLRKEEVELDEGRGSWGLPLGDREYFKRMSDTKLKSWIRTNDLEIYPTGVFKSQIDAAKFELKSRGKSRMKEEVGLDEITSSRPRSGGGREAKKSAENLKKHYQLMQKYIKQGMSKEDASKKAYKEIVGNINESSKSLGVAKKVPAKDGGYFVVLHRNTSGMSGAQDKFIMRTLKDGKVKEYGSHASLSGALKFAKSKGIIEAVDLDEKRGGSNYTLYHSDFSSAMKHAYEMAKKNYGITVDPNEIDDKVATGPRKPSEGKTNTYRLKGDKGAIQVQVYNKGGNKPYELNMYKESVDLRGKETFYKATAEKSQFGGYTPILKNSHGKTTYSSQNTYKTPEDAKGEAKAYYDGYFFGQVSNDDRGANRAVKAYKQKNKAKLYTKESVEVKRSRDRKKDDEETSVDMQRDVKPSFDKLRTKLRIMDEGRGRPRKDGSSAAGSDVENIQMQLRKSISLNGQKEVIFIDGAKVEVSPQIARVVLRKIDQLPKPQDKQNAVNFIMKSYKNLQAFAKNKEGDLSNKTGREKLTSLLKKEEVRKSKNPFDEQNQVDVVKQKIKREKEADKKKHDRMLDRARMADTRTVNRAPTTEDVELDEGVNDPAIFKAVFLAGGPGSGKSFMVDKSGLKSLGFISINSDTAFEAAMKKANIDPTPENIGTYEVQLMRSKAGDLTRNHLQMVLKNRMGIIIDGTGHNYERIVRQARMVKELGYDTSMVFVNTDKETALDRNNKRERRLPDNLVNNRWKAVHNNIGKFQSFFKDNMIIIDNSDKADTGSETNRVYKQMRKFVAKPPENKIASNWLKKQKALRGITEENTNLNESFTAGISDIMFANDFEEHQVHGGFAYHPSVYEASSDPAIMRSLNTMNAEGLQKLYVKLYKKEYDGISKSELISRIKKKIESYQHLYDLIMEKHGAGEEGTNKLVKKYRKDTPGEKDCKK